jgi:hypothetical protein
LGVRWFSVSDRCADLLTSTKWLVDHVFSVPYPAAGAGGLPH